MIGISDFLAKITAYLDTSKIEHQIKALEKGQNIKINVDADKPNKDIESLSQSIDKAGKTALSMGSTLKKSFSIGSAAAIVAKGFRLISTAAKEAVNAVKEFDDSITKLRLVTNQSYNDVKKITIGYNSLAKQLGATTTEVTDSANTWLHQGKSISETNTLIKNSMILSKVANLDAADSATYLTSATKGFNVETKDTISIIDKLTSVDLVSATSVGGLAEAMSRTAVSAELAGVNMDKLLGYIASVGEVTQKSMSSIGEFYKTLFTRMSNVKLGKTEALNEDGTIESLSDVETVLSSLDIKLRQSNNEFRNFGDVLDEVAKNWNSYSNVQQAAISKSFAGTRQSENFKVLMQNYDKAASYAEISANSAGMATKKFEAYLDSLEAKTKTLQASFESLAFNTISADSIGGIIEASTALVVFLDKTNLVKSTLAGLAVAGAIKSFSLLTSGISLAAIRMAEFNTALTLLKAGNVGENEIARLSQLTSNLSKSQLKAVISSKALTTEQRIAILTAQGMTTADAKATLSTMGLATAEGVATGATTTLSGVLKGLWATLIANPLTIAVMSVTAVVSAFSLVKKHTEELKQKADEVTSTYKEQTEALKNTKEKLDDLSERYEALSKGVDEHNKNISLTNTEYDEYLNICNQIGDMIPSLIQGFDNQGNAILKCKGNVEELTKAYEDEIKAANSAIIVGGSNVFKAFKSERKDLMKDQNGYEKLDKLLHSSNLKDAISKYAAVGTPNMVDVADLLREKAKIKQGASESGEEYIERCIKENRVIVESIVLDYNKQLADATQGVSSLSQAFIENSLFDEKFAGLSAEVKTGIKTMVREFGFEFYKDFDSLDSMYSALLSWLNNMINPSIPQANPEALANSEAAIEQLKQQSEKLKSSFSEIFSDGDKDSAFKTSVDAYIDQVTKLKSSLEKLKEDDLDSKTKIELFEQFPALASQANDLDSAIVNLIGDMQNDIDSSLYEQLKDMATDEDRAALEAYRKELLDFGNVADDVRNIVESLTSTLDKVEKGKNVLKSATEEMRENGEISQSTLKSIMELVDEGENWVDYIKLENGQLKLNVELWQEKIKDSLKLELTNFENELELLKKQNDEIVKQIALYKTKKSVLEQESTLTEQDSKLFNPLITRRKYNSSFPNNINPNMLWSPYDAELKKNADKQKLLKDNIDVLKALMDDYDREFESSISGNDKSKSSDPKQYNWIETAIDRIKRKISSLSNTVSSKFKSLSKRNEAAKDEISEITKEIEIQEKAYKKYLKLADSVKLSEPIKELVRNGTVDVSEYSEETAKLIDNYKEWYEASLNTKEAIDELHESLSSLYDDEFSRIETEFKNRLSLVGHLSNMYNTGMDTLEAKGYIATTGFYKVLSSVSENNITVLKDELSSLESSMQKALSSGEIEKYSEAWYGYQISINGVKEEIADATKSLAEFAKTIKEIEWQHFEYLQDRISGITNESKFLKDLIGEDNLFDKNGKLNNNGLSILGLSAMDYNVYMAQADKYAEEIRKIDSELAKDPYNTNLIEQREKLLDLQQKMILAAEDEKKSLVDLVENGIEKELSSLKELIDAYKEALDSAKDLHDYEKRINDQTSDIAKLQKQILAYQGDNSEEIKATVQKLSSELAKSKDSLKETEYERYISEQKKLLDDLYSRYETSMNQRLDNVDVLITDLIATVNQNSGTIGSTIEMTANNVGYTITDNMRDIWFSTSNQMQGAMGQYGESIRNVVAMYGENFGNQLTTTNSVLNNISSLVQNLIASSNNYSNSWIGGTNSYTPDYSGWTSTFNPSQTPDANQNPNPSWSPGSGQSSPVKEITVGGRINAGNAIIYRHESKSDGGNTQYYKNDPVYTVLSQSINRFGELMLMVRHHSLSSGVTGYFKKSDVKAYKTGGLVDETGLAWLDGTPQKPETVLDAEDTKNLFDLVEYAKEFASKNTDIFPKQSPLMKNTLRNLTPPALTGIVDYSREVARLRETVVNQNQNNYFTGDTHINIDHVESYEDFCQKLKNDPKFARFMWDSTIGRTRGRNSLEMNRFR